MYTWGWEANYNINEQAVRKWDMATVPFNCL